MHKHHKILIICLIAAVPVAAGIGVLAWRLTRHTPLAKVAAIRRPITYSIENIGSVDAGLIAGAMRVALGELPTAQQGGEADITISGIELPGSQGIALAPAAEPKVLNPADPMVVKTVEKPQAFIKFNNSRLSVEDQAKLVSTLTHLQSSTQQWTLNALGDIIIGRTVYEQEMRRNDYTSSFAKVASVIKAADLTVANNESTLADGIPYPLAGLSFAAPKKAIDGFVFAGIDAVGLANNHAFNGGASAFVQMIGNFNARGIKTFGGGANESAARTPAIIDVKGTKVALLAFDAIPGNGRATATTAGQPYISMPPWGPLSEADIVKMETDIKAAKAQADVVIPYFHWSQEYTHGASEQMRTLAHRAIDAGATMVVGSHPHWVQGIEWYNGHLVSYSLGNFIFDQEQSLKTKQGMFLTATFDGPNLIEAKYTPIQIENYFQPHILEGAAASQVLNDVYSHSWWPITSQ